MSRVLLFVQHGDARPKCVWTGASARRVAGCYARDEVRNAASSGPTDHVPLYWLVECANAEAGRACIAWWSYAGLQTATAPAGRILASGGKR